MAIVRLWAYIDGIKRQGFQIMPKLKIGTDDFKEMRDQGGYFVDKSRFVRAVIGGSKCQLLPRPRRFGKTLNMSMLRYFFEKSSQDRRPLFDGLEVAGDAEAMAHQGRYPVLFMSLKDIKANDWAGAKLALSRKVARLYLGFAEVADGLPLIDRQAFDRLCEGRADDNQLNDSLANLISHLYAHYGQPVVVLIDEYDSPVIEAWNKGYYEEMIDFLRGWLGAGLKHEDGPALFRAVITGILRVAKESIFSGLNNLTTASMLTRGPFADAFGFTQAEVDRLLDDFALPELGGPIRDWYNGYDFGGVTIYNPWSVACCVAHHPTPIGPQWLNTASNELVHAELEAGGLEVKRDLEKLLAGEELRYPLVDSITFRDIGRGVRNIWSFLYYSGYLRATDPRRDPLDETALLWRLSIPNLEVSVAYRQFVDRIYTEFNADGVRPLLDCFIEDRPAADFERVLQELALSLVSHHDVARQAEAVFHAFVLGLLAGLRSVYEIRSNAESGYGRADIVMRPKTDRYPLAYVIEFKSVAESADAESALAAALAQIETRDYAAPLRAAGVRDEHLRKLAVVLAGKRIHVRRG